MKVLPIQHFEAEFLWKVSLKILNSGIILKTFTNAYIVMFSEMAIGTKTTGLCHLLITFANSLDPDQARHFVGPDLDPNCLTL